MSTATATFSLVNCADVNAAMSTFVAWMSGGKRTPQEIAEAQAILREFTDADRSAALAAVAAVSADVGFSTWHTTPSPLTLAKGKRGELDGTLSLYGVGRNPMSTYVETWLAIFARRKAIMGTIETLVKTKAVTLKNPGRYAALFAAAVAGDDDCRHNGTRQAKDQKAS